ncbi:MAG: preprotein translocase subunit YajC [Candidatus Omnitrophica bacterium]|nr:preprotein translocase subunit YajC [Candidatus Omnitrophota bacterium]MCF7894673.1 preprotein translocase subunit YajC [Candidatus Omnitrophota bacterium]
MDQGTGNVFYQLIPLIFLFAVFYFLLIRPQKKQQKQHRMMIANLKKNDQVVTSGGIHGTIVAVKDKTFTLRIDEGTKIQIDKNAISYLKK